MIVDKGVSETCLRWSYVVPTIAICGLYGFLPPQTALMRLLAILIISILPEIVTVWAYKTARLTVRKDVTVPAEIDRCLQCSATMAPEVVKCPSCGWAYADKGGSVT